MNTKQPNNRIGFRFSILQALGVLTLTGVASALYASVGPLSFSVVCLTAMAIGGFWFRYLYGWNSCSPTKQLFAGLSALIWFGIVAIFSIGFWMAPTVRANRLTTIYNSSWPNKDLRFSINQARGPGLFVTISGGLESEADFKKLRNDILKRFNAQPYVYLQWNVTINGTSQISGNDHELFPDE